MSEERRRRTIVIGHKNPDTDSICSAICYAALKSKITGKEYVAGRAGHVNEETQYVLNYFNVEAPQLVESVKTQVKDIEIRATKGVERNISLKKAWNLMQDAHVTTLPAVSEKSVLEGLITVGDITKSYMNVLDSSILSKAHTQYKNILETLEGAMVVGDENDYFDQGKVLIAAANPDMMEYYISEHDLVILGNRYESQLCAIEMEADCIIVCEGAAVSMTIRKLAQEHGCTVMTTPYDAYTAARLINQSMPIGFRVKEGRDYWGGYWKMSNGFDRRILYILLVFGIIYFICAILLESLKQAMIVMLIVPLSFIGCFLGFYCFGLVFNEGGLAAFILMCGLSVNAVLYIQNDYNNKIIAGKARGLQTYLSAWNAKIIPILLTVISTILGFIPFLIGSNVADFWISLAIGTMSGLIFSVLVLMIYLPLFFMRKEDKAGCRRKNSGMKEGGRKWLSHIELNKIRGFIKH